MRNKQIGLVVALVLLGLVTAGVVLAAGETVSRSVMAGGGQTVADAGQSYVLQGTLAEPIAGNRDTKVEGHYHIRSGFWIGSPEVIVEEMLFLPVLFKSNIE